MNIFSLFGCLPLTTNRKSHVVMLIHQVSSGWTVVPRLLSLGYSLFCWHVLQVYIARQTLVSNPEEPVMDVRASKTL